ncbi:class I SAM-dependent methyltransferase [Rathayibacter soli]|uniref:class I SAM-dependent methyltransferase n=1 Tax=Rathayibacter soli TaxID=3144168 RepID=UPI0027E49C13|nr:class I SAM-dependent methyltransferase [Glaciibacter superstes]
MRLCTVGYDRSNISALNKGVSTMANSAAADDSGHGSSTSGDEYAQRLRRLDESRWRRVLNVQAPYRWNIRRLRLGRTLDIGCGLGRNLAHLGGNGVGVDHNAASIKIARQRGLNAFTTEEFLASAEAQTASFDSLLLAHVIEHLSEDFARELLSDYLRYLKPGGKVCLITPQERGYATDATHVTFTDFAMLAALCTQLGLHELRHYSFPFPRAAGKLFPYNEFVLVATKPA